MITLKDSGAVSDLLAPKAIAVSSHIQGVCVGREGINRVTFLPDSLEQ